MDAMRNYLIAFSSIVGLGVVIYLVLHNSHFVYKDICFTQCCLCNLKYARQKTLF